MHGRQLRVFLFDGTATGVKYAELVNWTGQAISVPKTKVAELKEWPEAKRSGVYLLLGTDDEGNDAAYFCESENVFRRLNEHLARPPFDFTEAITFTSKDDNLSKGHITFLEEKLIERAKETKHRKVFIDRQPSEKNLSRAEIATMLEFLDNIYLVTATLGQFLLGQFLFERPPERPTSQSQGEFIFELGHAGLAARGYPIDAGFMVLRGSNAKKDHVQSLQGGYDQLRNSLVDNGILSERDGSLEFNSDYVFSSSTAAACVISGNQRSGPASWKKDGKTLAEVQAEEAYVTKGN
jgi:Domain of unknown function (DUF4357)